MEKSSGFQRTHVNLKKKTPRFSAGKFIVTHHSPDLDAITSIWLIKKFLPGWEKVKIRFVPAGERIQRLVSKRLASSSKKKQLNAKRYTLDAIEIIGEDEIIHVDTGLGVLDHHQIKSDRVSAASLTLDFIRTINTVNNSKLEAISRIVKLVIEVDHFKEVLWSNPAADYHDFSLLGILEGLRSQFPNKEKFQVDFMIKNLDALLHFFENKIWAEQELKKGIKFKTRIGEGRGFATVNDAVLPLAQKLGFSIVLRKDPRKGYLRIKVRPDVNFDLTEVYKKLKKLDPAASWFLHVSKRMLLNGTTKNPKMRPTKLSLQEIIEVLKGI